MFIVLLIFVVQILFTYIGGSVLRTVGLTFAEWVYVILFSILIIPFDIIRKVFLVPRIRNYYLRNSKSASYYYDDIF